MRNGENLYEVIAGNIRRAMSLDTYLNIVQTLETSSGVMLSLLR